ncbi:M13-type metalloendopeptidase [Acetobacterium wieringae]|uniref:M13-type metalloendopeptidase n=1 Tax=Acetobacterium wieringae TaxID=52694 RepID=UPI0026EFC4C7|nr:M13 family metallopeptidase [Acetobacterium wieringae]
MRKRLLALAIISLFLLAGCNNATNKPSAKPQISEDYYGFINYDLLQQKTIPATEGAWSYFYELIEKTSGQLQEIVTELADDPGAYPLGSSEQKISDLYHCAMNLDLRNTQGLTAIAPYLTQLDAAQTLDQYLDALIALSDIGESSLIEYDFYPDDLNSDIMMVGFESMSDLIGKQYMENDSMQEYCDAYQTYIAQMLVLCGEDERLAKTDAEAIYSFAKTVAAKSLTPDEFFNPEKYYNVYSYDELQALYSNINMKKYLDAQGLTATDRYVVFEVEAIKQLNTMLTEENLPVLKAFSKFVLLDHLAPYAPVAYRDLKLEMNMKLDGSTEKKSDQRLASDKIQTLLKWEFGKIYSEKYFNAAAKQDVENMVTTILDQYKTIINNQDWMSPTTKEKALLKLDTMTLKIGYPNQWPTIGDYLQVTPITSGGGYLSNVVGLQQKTRQYEYDQYKKGVDRQTWYITPQTINAYYNPAYNEICFPAAILQAPFYDAQSSRGKNLGGIGAIIAHEISHAFDKTGSLYDEKGNYNIWWTDEEYQQYEALSQKIIDYYGAYTIFTGDPVNGTLTLSENIADLGAVTAITAVAKEEGASLDDVYSNWATIWANLTTPDQAKEHIINNTHAPAEIRANAVLSSMDGFYECYDIKAGDQMYVAPENRVGIWQVK